MNRIRGNDEQQWQEIITRALDKQQFADITTAGADVEFSIEHGLRSIPLGFLVIKQDKACSVYNGATPWDSEKIYLKANAATVALRVMVF